MILANRVPIAEDELLDYLIEGVTDLRLQNQARLTNFQSGAELLKAFGKITLTHKKSGEDKSRKDGVKSSGGGRTETLPTGGKAGKSPRWQAAGQAAARRGRSPARRTCYVCGAVEHLAKECPRRNRPMMSTEPTRDAVQAAATNLVHPHALARPYMVTIKLLAKDRYENLCHYVMDAIIDSGSPISLLRSSVIPGESRLLGEESIDQFCGINGSRLVVDGIFHGDVDIKGVRIKIKFYMVPDSVMAYHVLLGRDFLNCPSLRVTLGETFEITNVEEECAVNHIMHVQCSGDSDQASELRINPAIGETTSSRIRAAYESCYLSGFNAEKLAPDVEMIIAHRTNNR